MKSSWLALVLLIVVFVPHLVLAGEADAEDYNPGPVSAYSLEQPFGGSSSVATIGEYIQLVYRFALGIVGIIAVVMIMFGGVMWIGAAGNESVIGQAKEIIVAAVTGLIIALLSYIILLVINPQFINTSVAILKIPTPTSCPIPNLMAIKDAPGLKGNGAQACPNLVGELDKVAAAMIVNCPTCIIQVGSGYRDSTQQTTMYACYQQCVNEGYITPDGLTHKKSGAPGGSCTYCAKTAKPCDSNHVQGKAVDLYFSVGGLAGYKDLLSSDAGDGANNNGKAGGKVDYSACASAPDPTMCASQQLLYLWMYSTGKFTNYSNEWWHFDYSGDCGVDSALACTTNATTGKADNAYCYYDNAVDTYGYAICGLQTPGVPYCVPPGIGSTLTVVQPGTCGAATATHFGYTSSSVSTLAQGALALSAPTCLP